MQSIVVVLSHRVRAIAILAGRLRLSQHSDTLSQQVPKPKLDNLCKPQSVAAILENCDY